ncbi:MAG: hypothetical protein WC832_13885 [Anaerolineales bacterium]
MKQQLALPFASPSLTPPPTDEPSSKVVFSSPPTIDELQKAWEGFDQTWEKARITFGKPTAVPVNRHNRKTITVMDIKLFVSTARVYCYTFHSRSGFPFSSIEYGNIISIAVAGKNEDEHIAEVRALARRIHPGTWDDLRKHLEEAPLEEWPLYRGEPRYLSMSTVFSDYVCEQICKAFETKREYSYMLPGLKRDRSISMKTCDDGIWRAWYSSEYSGCGNGGYYLLINPSTAVFYEND